jgi:hypothetical protein
METIVTNHALAVISALKHSTRMLKHYGKPAVVEQWLHNKEANRSC